MVVDKTYFFLFKLNIYILCLLSFYFPLLVFYCDDNSGWAEYCDDTCVRLT